MPIDELNLAAAAPPSPPRPKRKKNLTKTKPAKTKPAKSEPTQSEPTTTELAISTELIVDFICRNVHPRKWKHFFDELDVRASPSILAMFKRVRPKSHERRPLNEATQVIEESGPKEMPEEPWDYLYACLEWFARWTQRVMPNAVWQEAMQQAMKTLLPRDPIRTLDGR